MSEDGVPYTVVTNPSDEEIARADVVEAGVDMFIASRARRKGAKSANETAAFIRRKRRRPARSAAR